MKIIPILAYHRVGDLKGDHVPTVTADSFEIQLRFLKRHGYQTIELNEFLAHPNARARAVVLTFDDGYDGTASAAAPLLRAYGFRATVFVTPGEIETPGFMSWQQVREIAGDGFTIGSHTMHHSYLPLLSREKVQQELAESKQALEERIDRPVEWLSYPIGGYTPEIQAAAKAAGYRGACTTNRGLSKRRLDPFALRRIKVTDRDRHPLLIWAKLSGFYDTFRQLEQPS